MNRWTSLRLNRRQLLSVTASGAVVLTYAGMARAQMSRLFPQGIQRGSITFGHLPQAVLNGQPVRLAPGLRVRNERNMIALPSSLVGQTFLVNYTVDPSGAVRDVWMLTPHEAATLPDGSPVPTPPRNTTYAG